MLQQRYGPELGTAERDVSEDVTSCNITWESVYDHSGSSSLYVLAREDWTITVGMYRQWERLSRENGIVATLISPVGESAAELGNLTISVLGESDVSDERYAVVKPEALISKPGE
jgi:hypothetical protein